MLPYLVGGLCGVYLVPLGTCHLLVRMFFWIVLDCFNC